MNEDFREEIYLYSDLYSERLLRIYEELLNENYIYDSSKDFYNKLISSDFINKNNLKDLYYMKSINKKEKDVDLDEYLEKYENIIQ